MYENPCGEIVLKSGICTLGFSIYTVRARASNGQYYRIPVYILMYTNPFDVPVEVAHEAYRIGAKQFGGFDLIDMTSIVLVKGRLDKEVWNSQKNKQKSYRAWTSGAMRT